MRSFWDSVFALGCRIEPLAPRFAAALKIASFRRVGEPEYQLVSNWIRPDTIALDIGANWGPYTAAMLRAGASAVAFEPNPVLAAALRKAWPSARIVEIGLSDSAVDAVLQMPIHNGQALDGYATMRGYDGASKDIPIKTRRLDEFAFENVSFIKIDVEGLEGQVLDGGWETIQRERPAMLIESGEAHAPGCPQAIVDRLSAIGYSVFFLRDGALQPYSTWVPAAAGPEHETVFNFFFLPDEK